MIWLKQGPKARSSKQKARLNRIEKMKEKPLRLTRNSLDITTKSNRIGKKIIEANSIAIRSSNAESSRFLIQDFNYAFNAEDRIGIIGPKCQLLIGTS